MPVVLQLVFAAAVVALGAGVLWVGGGGIGALASGLAGAVGGVIDDVTATPEPTAPPPATVADPPSIVPPAEPYTSGDAIDVAIRVPPAVAGSTSHSVRLYVTLKDTPTALVTEASVGATSTVVLPAVALGAGANDFHATIVGPGGESEPSEIVRWVLDRAAPKITLTSPKDGAVVNRAEVALTGKTQGRSTLVARNEANGATATGTAESDGTFELAVPLKGGTNGITLTVTDPAGNAKSMTISIRRGSGKLTASLRGSAYRYRVSRLPDDVEFEVAVNDPDGRPLRGARVIFTITVPGVEPIVSSELETAGDGRAVFRARIPRGATPGDGLATVLVTTAEFGRITDRQVLTVVR